MKGLIRDMIPVISISFKTSSSKNLLPQKLIRELEKRGYQLNHNQKKTENGNPGSENFAGAFQEGIATRQNNRLTLKELVAQVYIDLLIDEAYNNEDNNDLDSLLSINKEFTCQAGQFSFVTSDLHWDKHIPAIIFKIHQD